MRILWFANTPCGAAEKLVPDQPRFGGWLKSLEEQLVQHNDIELFICFYWAEELEPFKYKKTTYYPMSKIRVDSGTDHSNDRALHCVHDDKKEVKKLLRVIDAVKPDLIHVHGTEDNFGLIQAYTETPVVISVQGILSSICEKYFSGVPSFVAYQCEGLHPEFPFQSVNFLYNDMKKRAVRERKILSQARYIIGRTDWDRRVTRLLAPHSRYFVGNEILRSSFYEKQWNKGELGDPPQIVTVVNRELYKGMETIVNTARILCENNTVNFKWTVVGQSESGNVAKIIKRWLKVDFKPFHIDLVGGKNETELGAILLNSDIYCQVSHIENSSNSLCEAMLIGMPVIASCAGGTDSILDNRKEGLLVQDGDPYSFAGAIVEMIRNSQKAIEYGKSARNTAMKRHDKECITNTIVAVYKNILSGR